MILLNRYLHQVLIATVLILLVVFSTISFQKPAEVKMLAFGDLMLGRDLVRLMDKHGDNYAFASIFGDGQLNPVNYNIVYANLEGPITKAEKRPDLRPYFAFDPLTVPDTLSKQGFTLLGLANNPGRSERRVAD